jgi:predicted enzyme related to lactoylglutathione lyase
VDSAQCSRPEADDQKAAQEAHERQMMSRICFVELPASDLASARSFYTDAFGLAFTDFGPSYSCTLTGDVDLGLQADAGEATSAPLAVIAVDDLEASLDAVSKAGGIITKPIFAFPGGRRFHFRDPSGNELAALKAD